ncbi:MAG TPA: universal stress protein [Candidatus Limnocylindria bacterium]|nr:universal stress protein [Candidatus Limnocylindria bacterium]
MKRIMHATDFSPASRAAFARALQEAKSHNAELTVVHVLSPVLGFAGEGYVSPSTYETLARSSRAWAQKQLDRLLAKAKGAGVRARGLLLDGVAHEQIAKAAKAKKADLLVMGTHGRTGMARFFVGSVAGRVVAGAPCPVLTVRGR